MYRRSLSSGPDPKSRSLSNARPARTPPSTFLFLHLHLSNSPGPGGPILPEWKGSDTLTGDEWTPTDLCRLLCTQRGEEHHWRVRSPWLCGPMLRRSQWARNRPAPSVLSTGVVNKSSHRGARQEPGRDAGCFIRIAGNLSITTSDLSANDRRRFRPTARIRRPQHSSPTRKSPSSPRTRRRSCPRPRSRLTWRSTTPRCGLATPPTSAATAGRPLRRAGQCRRRRLGHDGRPIRYQDGLRHRGFDAWRRSSAHFKGSGEEARPNQKANPASEFERFEHLSDLLA